MDSHIARDLAKTLPIKEISQETETSSTTSITSPSSNPPLFPNHTTLSAGSWPRFKKLIVVTTGLLLNFNVTFSSSLPSGATDSLSSHFNLPTSSSTSTGETSSQLALPVSLFLTGYIFGPIIFGPLSESYGRKICLVSSFLLYTAFTLGCALAPTWPALLIFRFFVGVGASAPQTVLSGMYSDIFPNLLQRGKAIMILGLTSNVGPLIGPMVAGYVSPYGWRWAFWVPLAMAGLNWPFLLILNETYEPVIIKRHLKSLSGNENGYALDHTQTSGISFKELVTKVLTRPIRMFAEPIVLFTDLFLLYEYAIFYLYFEAYPLIFKGVYGMNSGEAALMLLPVGIGAVVAMFVFLWYDRYLVQSKAAGKAWAHREEYRRLPLACLGGPLYAISQFWLAWTATPSIHWSVPALSGIPMGMGIDLTFMALMNYLTDAYGVYSASAMASSVFSRNIVAAILLPLGSFQMYERLSIPWACSLLGFMCLAMVPIPFAFIKWGPQLRERSPFCQQLKKESEKA